MMGILDEQWLAGPQTNYSKRHNHTVVIVGINRYAAFHAFRCAMHNDLVPAFLDLRTGPGQLCQIVRDAVAFLVTQILHIIEA